MLDDLDVASRLLPMLRVVCDDLPIPISIADPDLDDTPLIYVNGAFEALTLYRAEEVIGKNCRFLQGRLTDGTVTDEIAHACQRRAGDSCCIINYRKDGSLFFNMLAIQPLRLDLNRTLLMGCQFAFRPTQTGGTLARTCALIDRAQRQMRLSSRISADDINLHDTFRIDTIGMRFEAAFTRVKNALIRDNSSLMAQGSSLRRREALGRGGFAGRDQSHIERLLG
ncbi:PAS domain-containing protein [Roseobacter sinensis]|uniref:PAS domain-containing protein n=1 Tax=Roseobacter sinensis TaxID=2931391 RepID=A0ABT3BHH0_9RHOB|nr:PAS domain-containing protein [Roseobacter sp. WL0113]MCV3273019.1 PAS domain-containing protein [Roseobacter sp. WL0113]